MTPEAAAYIEKARMCLAHARMMLDIKELGSEAGRNAYLAAFHAAQAFILVHTGKAAKTHSGVRSEFARLAKADTRIDSQFPAFLAQAYLLKEVADYELGPGSIVPRDRVEAAIQTATRFVDCIEAVLLQEK